MEDVGHQFKKAQYISTTANYYSRIKQQTSITEAFVL